MANTLIETEGAQAIRAQAKALKFKIPAKEGDLVDLLYELKQTRREEQKKVDAIEAQEKLLEALLIETLPTSNLEGLLGTKAKVQIISRIVPTAKDWEAITAYMVKNKDFALVQRRLNEKHITDLWDAKKTVPGVEKYNAKKVSVTKL